MTTRIRVFATDEGNNIPYGSGWFSMPPGINLEYSVFVNASYSIDLVSSHFDKNKSIIQGRFMLYRNLNLPLTAFYQIAFENEEDLAAFKLLNIDHIGI